MSNTYTIKRVQNGWVVTTTNTNFVPIPQGNIPITHEAVFTEFVDLISYLAHEENQNFYVMDVDKASGKDYSTVSKTKQLVFDSDTGESMHEENSYSQFLMWKECPFRWKLNYIDRIGKPTQNINMLFGTAMHETLQTYIKVMYEESLVKADELDLPKMLFERMKANLIQSREKKLIMEITPQEMVEFYEDGIEIIEWFLRHRHEYFSKRGFEPVGVEVPLDYPVQDGVHFMGYLDFVIRDTVLNKYKIFDIKTSRMGWNKYQKKDKNKLMQLILYKAFYAAQFEVKPADVDVEFIILKRKLYENMDFPQKRFQRIKPASGTITQNEILRELKIFINTCFNEKGKYRTDIEYPKYPSQKTCKYCDFANFPEICDRNKGKRKGRKPEKLK